MATLGMAARIMRVSGLLRRGNSDETPAVRVVNASYEGRDTNTRRSIRVREKKKE